MGSREYVPFPAVGASLAARLVIGDRAASDAPTESRDV